MSDASRDPSRSRPDEFDPVAPAHFVRTVGAELRSFAARKPSLEQWRDEVAAQFRDEASFVDYLREDFHPFDVLFVVLGVITAFGMLSKATVTLRAAAQAAEAEAAAAPAGDGANEPPRA